MVSYKWESFLSNRMKLSPMSKLFPRFSTWLILSLLESEGNIGYSRHFCKRCLALKRVFWKGLMRTPSMLLNLYVHQARFNVYFDWYNPAKDTERVLRRSIRWHKISKKRSSRLDYPHGQLLDPPLARNVKTDRGFHHGSTGALLCPTGIDWSDSEYAFFCWL